MEGIQEDIYIFWEDLSEYRDMLFNRIIKIDALITALLETHSKTLGNMQPTLESTLGIELTLKDIIESLGEVAKRHMSDPVKKTFKIGKVNKDDPDEYMDFIYVLTNYHNADIQLEIINKFVFVITQTLSLIHN